MPRVDPRTHTLASNVRDRTDQIPPNEPLPLCGSRKITITLALGIPPVSSLEETRPSSSDHTEKSGNPHRAKQIQHGRRERGRMRRNGSGTPTLSVGVERTVRRGGIPSLHFTFHRRHCHYYFEKKLEQRKAIHHKF